MNPTLAAMYPGPGDCHIHIYEEGYPFAPHASAAPPPAQVSACRQVQKAPGLTRAVIVQPTGYGFDDSCTLEREYRALYAAFVLQRFEVTLRHCQPVPRFSRLIARQESTQRWPPHSNGRQGISRQGPQSF
ncbi:amidohydrolase family protein [Paraburkholderia atlantica]|uniref:amidohydrolase family protein n=2 Tax=Paraburkholderia atlantica TaxID=2654982 RepID=UPI003D1A6AE3